MERYAFVHRHPRTDPTVRPEPNIAAAATPHLKFMCGPCFIGNNTVTSAGHQHAIIALGLCEAQVWNW